MAEPGGQEPPYQVHASAAVRQTLRELQRQAARQGRGDQALAAFKNIVQQLQQDPANFGEPLYRLASLRLQVRLCARRPMVVEFAVHEERPLVFVNGVRLMAQ
jgi:hypothetical protein